MGLALLERLNMRGAVDLVDGLKEERNVPVEHLAKLVQLSGHLLQRGRGESAHFFVVHALIVFFRFLRCLTSCLLTLGGVGRKRIGVVVGSVNLLLGLLHLRVFGFQF